MTRPGQGVRARLTSPDFCNNAHRAAADTNAVLRAAHRCAPGCPAGLSPGPDAATHNGTALGHPERPRDSAARSNGSRAWSSWTTQASAARSASASARAGGPDIPSPNSPRTRTRAIRVCLVLVLRMARIVGRSGRRSYGKSIPYCAWFFSDATANGCLAPGLRRFPEQGDFLTTPDTGAFDVTFWR